jgi:hypothetical protein
MRILVVTLYGAVIKFVLKTFRMEVINIQTGFSFFIFLLEL